MQTYKSMTEGERLAAFNRTGQAQLAIEACRNPSPSAVKRCISEMAFIERVARSQGDKWAQA